MDITCVIINHPQPETKITTSFPAPGNKSLRVLSNPAPYAVFTEEGISFVYTAVNDHNQERATVISTKLNAFPPKIRPQVEEAHGLARPKPTSTDVQDLVRDLGVIRASHALRYTKTAGN